MIRVGDKVKLLHGGIPGSGSLNTEFLDAEGYTGECVPVIAVEGKYAIVQLPSGYKLEITERDVLKTDNDPLQP
jgi:hypothetical protein